MFKLCVDHKSWKPFLGIFSDLFSEAHTSLDDARDQRFISLHPQVPWLNYFASYWGDLFGAFKAGETRDF